MTRARVSIVGFEQRKDSPLSVLRKRKPPAAALAVPALATSGRTTRAVLLDVLVMTDPGWILGARDGAVWGLNAYVFILRQSLQLFRLDHWESLYSAVQYCTILPSTVQCCTDDD